MTRFDDGDELDGAAELAHEQTLLFSFIGRPVLVLFSGADGSPFISGILSGRLDRGELDERLQEVRRPSASSAPSARSASTGS